MRLQAKQGEFGTFLQLAHNWADFDNTKKSYELWRRHVSPVINGMNSARQDSYDWAVNNSPEFVAQANKAISATITKHKQEVAAQAEQEAKVA